MKIKCIKKTTDYTLTGVIGFVTEDSVDGIITLESSLKGYAPINKAVEQMLAVLDGEYILEHGFDIIILLNNIMLPPEISERDITIAAAYEIIKD